MGNKKQFYGIKFPFTSNNNMGFFLDLNSDLQGKVASEIAHVILTPKSQRIRMPEFGTDLIKYIFGMNDSSMWVDIEKEIKEQVSKYVPNCNINEINVVKDENEDNAVYVEVKYGVIKGVTTENNRMVIKL